MTELRYAQKNVPSLSVAPGDQIFRDSPDHGDLMMSVESATQGVHQGQNVCIWRGTVYKLSGSGTGPSPFFLGEITGSAAGKGEWKKPVDSTVTKGVPTEDADYEY